MIFITIESYSNVGRWPHGVCCRLSVDTDFWSYYQNDSAFVMLEKTAVLPKNFRRFFRTAPRRSWHTRRRNFRFPVLAPRKIPVSTAPAFERHCQAVFGLVKIATTFDVALRDVRFIVINFKEFSSATACCKSVDKRLVAYLLFGCGKSSVNGPDSHIFGKNCGSRIYGHVVAYSHIPFHSHSSVWK